MRCQKQEASISYHVRSSFLTCELGILLWDGTALGSLEQREDRTTLLWPTDARLRQEAGRRGAAEATWPRPREVTSPLPWAPARLDSVCFVIISIWNVWSLRYLPNLISVNYHISVCTCIHSPFYFYLQTSSWRWLVKKRIKGFLYRCARNHWNAISSERDLRDHLLLLLIEHIHFIFHRRNLNPSVFSVIT